MTSCTSIYILFYILFHYGLSWGIDYSSWCYTVGPCCPPILYIIVCINPKLPVHPPPTHSPLCCCSVTESCMTLCNFMNCSTPGFPLLHYLLEFVQAHVHCVSDDIQPSHPLSPPFPLPSIFPSIRVFSNELALHIRWPKYWHFSRSPCMNIQC